MLEAANLLRIPGPTPIPPSVTRAMTKAMIGHRTKEAMDLLVGVKEKLKPVFGTKQDVTILAGSGSAGLEASIVNITDVGDEVLVLVSGNFGERFAEICTTYGLTTHRLEVEWGKAIEVADVETALKEHPNIKAVFVTACETSTGVLNPIKEITATIRENSSALVVVDGVSSVGGVVTEMDEWGIDVLVTGSQKAMMLPPGLCFVAASERAWQVIHENKRQRYYLDLRKYLDYATPYTPAMSLLIGLDEALDLLAEEGLANVYQRHTTMMKMTRAAAKALGLELLTSDEAAAPTVTTIAPSNFAGDDLRKLLKADFGLELAGGQKHLKGKVIRVGHMGYCSPADILQVIGLLEVGLQKLNVAVTPGQGVKAAQDALIQAGGQIK